MTSHDSKRHLLVTYALPYANGSLHLGHIVGLIQADIWVRFQKMQGHPCVYVCGCDAHGTPIMIQAEKMDIDPEVMVEQIRKEHYRDIHDFHVGLDTYHTTHSTENRRLVETIYERHVEQGNIEQKVIQQAFDPEKNLFLPDRFIKGECPRCSAKDQYGDSCEVCGATYLPTDLKNPYSTLSGEKPIQKSSEHYFFKLSRYETFLREWTQQGHLQEEVTHKLDEWFSIGLEEWDISRDAPYFGFNIPGRTDKYFYCWLDAPIGYIASFDYLASERPELHFDTYWGKDSSVELHQFIGKDIMYFHALFWPALLKGAGLRTPTTLNCHGFLTIDGQKMSKSRGTFIKARTYLDYLPPEYFRYYLAAKLSARIEDLDIHFDDFMLRVNADLVNKWINLASRSAKFIHQYFEGRLSSYLANAALLEDCIQEGEIIAKQYEAKELSQVIRLIMVCADKANAYFDEKKPWVAIKDPALHEDVHAVCTTILNIFRVLTIYLKPVLPELAKKIEHFFQVEPFQWQDKNTPLLNHVIAPFQPLATRIDSTHLDALKNAAREE